MSLTPLTVLLPPGWDFVAVYPNIDSLAEDCSNSSALAMELLLSYAKPAICHNTARNTAVSKAEQESKFKLPKDTHSTAVGTR